MRDTAQKKSIAAGDLFLDGLFGGAKTLSEMLDHAAERFAGRAAVNIRANGAIEARSYLQLQADAYAVGSALKELGLESRNIAVIGSTGYEWLAAFFGITGSGNTVVPLDKDLPPSEIEALLLRSDAAALLVDNSRLDLARLIRDGGRVSSELFTFRPAEGFRDLQQLISPKATNRCGSGMQLQHPDPDGTALIVYTAGDNGLSRGAMLTHRNISDNVRCCVHLLGPDTLHPGERTVPVLPPHHLLGITAGILTPLLHYGVTVCFGGGLNDFLKNVVLFKPSMLIVVPMIAESLYRRVLREARRLGSHDRLLSQPADRLAGPPASMGERREQYAACLEALGGELRVVVSGGAFLDPVLVDRYGELGLYLLNGYGITECSPVISCNTPDDIERLSVGRLAPLPYCEVRIQDGEIQVRGSIVTCGYYKDEASTAAAFQDGWFRTGDLGDVDGNNRLYLTGRLKDLIILKDGNNISPAELEHSLEAHPLVRTAFVYAVASEQGDRLAAAIHPDYLYADSQGIQDVGKAVSGVVESFNDSAPPYKRIRSIEIREEAFDKRQWTVSKRKHLESSESGAVPNASFIT